MDYLKCSDKLKIAFVFQVGSFWPSWETLYEACIKDMRFDVKIFWLGMDGDAGDKAQMEFAEDFLIERNLPYEVFSDEKIMQFMPHYMIYQTPYDFGHRTYKTCSMRYKRKGIRIVYIPYGIEISDTLESRYKHFSLPTPLNAFALYTLSDEMKKEYEKYCLNADAVKATGLPRFDSLRKPYELPECIKERVGERKIVLWKTHFPKIFIEKGVKKQATPDLDEYIKFIDYISENQDIFFIFMPHPKFADETIDEEFRPRAVQVLDELEKLPNVFIDNGADYRNSLTNADAIIIDRSAVMVEAGMKGVPVLYMYNADYNEPMTPPIQKLLDSYYQGVAATDMIAFCDSVKKGEDVERERRIAAFKECVPFGDGMCAERIMEDLWEGAHKDTHFEMIQEIRTGSKVVIFGTGELGHICMEAYNERAESKFEISCFVDNDIRKQGSSMYGRKIISADSLEHLDYNYIVIATDKYYREIYLQLTKELKISAEKLIKYDEFIIMAQYGQV